MRLVISKTDIDHPLINKCSKSRKRPGCRYFRRAGNLVLFGMMILIMLKEYYRHVLAQKVRLNFDININTYGYMVDPSILLSYGASYKRVVTGEIIFQEGQQAHFYYQLESGRIKWLNIDDDGREFIQAIIEPGESFGEFPLFDGEPYAAGAVADKDSVVLRLHESGFHQLLKDHPEIHLSFTRLMVERLRFKFLFSKEVANHHPQNIITSLINHFKKEKHYVCKDCSQVQLTRQQIADMTGLRVETVIRAIRNMHNKGIVKVNRGKVYC